MGGIRSLGFVSSIPVLRLTIVEISKLIFIWWSAFAFSG